MFEGVMKAYCRRFLQSEIFHANFQVTKIQSTLTDTPSKTDRQRTMKSSLCSEKYPKTEM